jgi:uncharacterized protein YxjI
MFGGAFHLRDADGHLILYSSQKRFRIRENISLYDTEAMQTELINITTQSIFDIAGSYAVRDVQTGAVVGGLKRKGISSSFLRDRWLILDADGREIGEIVEDSAVKAIARRVLDEWAFFLPQKYHATIGDVEVATFQSNINPFVYKLEIDFSMDTENVLDPRLGLAAAVLLAAIEGKQN